ncbi:MAG: MotA/TolQ/ExbB proton channel family protein [Sphingomonadaceae bacterium]
METVATENPYGLIAALEQGGIVAQGLFGIMVLMSVVSWYIIFAKWFEQRKLLNESQDAARKVWSSASLKEGAAKLPKNSAYRQVLDDGMRAAEHHEGQLTDQINQNDWITISLNRSAGLINSRMQWGLSFLASTGAVAPFIGLLGTVIGIYRALINIGIAGQASIDKVAGPVGEALIMTAIGIGVAVPAVLGYNYLAGRNKKILERLNVFAADIHAYLLSGSSVSPTVAIKPTTTMATGTVPTKPAGK